MTKRWKQHNESFLHHSTKMRVAENLGNIIGLDAEVEASLPKTEYTADIALWTPEARFVVEIVASYLPEPDRYRDIVGIADFIVFLIVIKRKTRITERINEFRAMGLYVTDDEAALYELAKKFSLYNYFKRKKAGIVLDLSNMSVNLPIKGP